MTAATEVERLAFAYPDGRQTLFGVDLSIEQGERVALLGPNGAGKTTFVLHLNGSLGLVVGGTGSGTVRIGGLPVLRSNLQEIRRSVGLVFHDPDDQLFMPTVADDVGFGPANLGLRGDELGARVVEALDQVGMAEHADRPPHHLSCGQRRHVVLATVLAMNPQVLVLDEPSRLDPASRRELADIVSGLGVTVLMVAHDLPYALQLCSRYGSAGRRPDRRRRSDPRPAGRPRSDVHPPPRVPLRLRPLSVPGAPPDVLD